MKPEHIAQIATADLTHVTGGVYRVGRGFDRAMVHGLKDMAGRRNQADGHMIQGMSAFLTDKVSSKVRSWLHGESINSLTKEMRENPSVLPAHSWSR